MRQMKRVNILGGGGLVGFGIYSILSKDYQVRTFSSDCFDFDKFSFKSDDIFDCDVFIHAAGVRDEEVVDNFDFGLKKSISLVNLILDGLNKFSCTKFVYISSIHVFGDLNLPIDSKRLPNPKTLYSFFHYCTEKVLDLQLSSGRSNFKLLILRVPTVYGFQKNMKKINRPNIIQNSFLVSLLEKGIISLKSNGKQFRLFSSNYKVGEIVRMWIRNESKEDITYETVNGQNLTVYNFALMCKNRFSALDENRVFQVKKINQQSLNDTVRPITVKSKYNFIEPYPVEKYIDDFFNRIRG